MAKQTAQPRPPDHLSTPARRLWLQLITDFVVEDAAGRVLLTEALVAWDRCEQARALIEKEGSIVRDRFGQPIPHPGVKIERDSRAQFLAALKQLNLDVQPVRPVGRPIGS
jgi:phage terminase small subunit